jgi:methionine-rich copper-binding protein CopC
MISPHARTAAFAALLVAVLLATVAGLALTAGPAEAHARYDHSDPADGASLTGSPARVNVWFAQDVRRSGGLPVLIVVNDTGDQVNLNAVLDDRDRTHMSADMPPALPPGRYTVIWHTLSDEDGEEAQGAFHFYVGVAAPPAPSVTATATATASATPAPAGEEDDSDSDVPAWGLALGILGGVVVGAAAMAVAGRRLR